MDQEIRQMESEGIRSPHPMIQRVRELYDGPVVARVFSDRILSPEWSGEDVVQGEIGRYIAWPGQSTAYMIGLLKI